MLNRERVPGTGLVLTMESFSWGPFDIQMQGLSLVPFHRWDD